MISYKCDACRAEIEEGRHFKLTLVSMLDQRAELRNIDLCGRCAAAVRDVVDPGFHAPKAKPYAERRNLYPGMRVW